LIEAVLFCLVTVASSFIGSMLGIGGGFLIVPALVLLGLPIQEAAALSLIAIAATSTSSSIIYLPKGMVNLKAAIILELFTVGGAIIGPRIALALRGEILQVLFGFILLYVSYRMLRGGKRVGEGAFARRRNLLSWAIAFIGSFLAGVMAGMLGIGGGIIKVPILHLLLGMSMKISVATSHFMIMFTAITSSIVYLLSGLFNGEMAVAGAVGAIVGSQIGGRIALRIKAEHLRRLFGIVLIILAATMFWKSLHP